jgi:hypothetical protein
MFPVWPPWPPPAFAEWVAEGGDYCPHCLLDRFIACEPDRDRLLGERVAQDERWRALVGRWAEAKRALMAVLAVESNDNAPIVNLGVMAVADAEDALMAALDGAE